VHQVGINLRLAQSSPLLGLVLIFTAVFLLKLLFPARSRSLALGYPLGLRLVLRFGFGFSFCLCLVGLARLFPLGFGVFFGIPRF
jgi:hypothetical protein